MKHQAPNVLDRLITWMSPRAGLARERARIAHGVLQRHYQAAARGRRTAGWTAPSTSGNAALYGLQTMRDRARDLDRNDVWIGAAHEVITSDVVGAGILAKVVGRDERQTAELQDLWDRQCRVMDAEGGDFYSQQAQVMATTVLSGSALCRIRPRLDRDGLPVPMQVQVIEPDHLDGSRDVLTRDGAEIKHGIQLGATGLPEGYWLWRRHPGENRLVGGFESTLVPADRVAHVYRKRRPGQVIDAPWAVRAMIRAKDFADFEDAHLLRQKIAGCWAAFTHDMDTEVDLTAPSTDSKGRRVLDIEEIEPGMIEDLPPGKDITFANPPGVTGYGEYTLTMLRGLARGFGISYEALSGDFSRVNFTSGRMGELRMRTNVDRWRWHMLIPLYCDRVFAWFLEAAALAGHDVRGASVEWTPPPHRMIDPATETRATKERIRIGITTLSEAIREQGGDPKRVLTELSEDLALLDSLGLVLDSDPRPHASSPGQQTQVSTSAPPAKRALAERVALNGRTH
jgi:lambda family phage portal protein